MKWKIRRDPVNGDVHFEGVVSGEDIHNVRLHGIERRLVSAPVKTGADLFKILEILFRRHEQQDVEVVE